MAAENMTKYDGKYDKINKEISRQCKINGWNRISNSQFQSSKIPLTLLKAKLFKLKENKYLPKRNTITIHYKINEIEVSLLNVISVI